MKITKKDIEQHFIDQQKEEKRKEGLYKEFYSVFEKKYIRSLINTPIAPGGLDKYFELCYKKINNPKLKEIFMESWINRNREIRKLIKFIQENFVKEITFVSDSNRKASIIGSAALITSKQLIPSLKKKIAEEYDIQKIKEGTARKQLILSIHPYYDYLTTNVFNGRGGSETASEVIYLTLQIFGIEWPKGLDKRSPEKVIYDILRKAKKPDPENNIND